MRECADNEARIRALESEIQKNLKLIAELDQQLDMVDKHLQQTTITTEEVNT